MTTIYGVNEDWQFILSKKGRSNGYITATADSRTFVHQYDPQPGQLVLDIYKSGQLAATVGPFTNYKGWDFNLREDGSISLLCWQSPEKEAVQLVVIGPDGTERFRADCDDPYEMPVPAPEGRGALLHCQDNVFKFYHGAVISEAVAIGPNAECFGWLPGTTKALFETSLGDGYRFKLIDWPAGEVLWDIPEPNPKRHHSAPAIAWAEDYLLLSNLEIMAMGDAEGPVRTIYALDVNTSEVVAQWLPKPLCHFYLDAGHFLKLGDKLFYIADEAFCEINPEDIATRV